jgi:hypothetical protein
VARRCGATPGSETLQGGFRINEFPSLAIDRSPKTSKGNLYIAWNEGRAWSAI